MVRMVAKKIHIETYGCQMNDYESDRTYRMFHGLGYEWTPQPAEADLVIYNTCSIREKADHKAFSSLGRLRPVKFLNPSMVIAVGGCMAQSRGEEIQKRAPYVDLVFGTHQWTNLPELVEKAQRERTQSMEIDFYGWKNYSFLPYQNAGLAHPVSELVTVQNGCNKFCTFCLVPFTRGREMSRLPVDILTEVEMLAQAGVKEVNLLGQNVNAYGKDQRGEITFAQLLRKVSEVDGIERVRFMTSHPSEFSDDLIKEMGENEKICEHLHLPLQSGSDRILEKMNRSYSLDDFRLKAQKLRAALPGLSLTTDIIVGFPGETGEDFESTMRALEEFEFDDSFSFVYSPRPHTKAAQWVEDFVEADLANERLIRLQAMQRELKTKKSESWVGKTVEVLVEGEAKSGPGDVAGRTRENWTVNFAGSKDWAGQLLKVQIKEARSNTLRGKMASCL